jgi:hypothetical protein
MRVSPKLALLGLAAVVPMLFARPAGADLAKWDQARVTGIAKQLASACDTWLLRVRQQSGTEIGPEDAPGMIESARVLREQSRSLADHLAKGKGYEETRNLYRSLKEIADDTEVQSRRRALGAPTLDAWAAVADPLRQIAPYYDPKALDE